MTPREVDEMTGDEYDAFLRYMRAELKAIRKAQARANSRR
jgi:hypothetical protein